MWSCHTLFQLVIHFLEVFANYVVYHTNTELETAVHNNNVYNILCIQLLYKYNNRRGKCVLLSGGEEVEQMRGLLTVSVPWREG